MNAPLRITSALAAVAAALALSGCGGGSSSPVAPVALATAAATTPAVSSSSSGVPYGAKILSGATFVRRAIVNSIGLDVEITMRDQAGLIAYAKSASDPKSSNYRRWLTPQQLGDKFGADPAQYAATAKYLTSLGIAVKQYPQRQVLRVIGSQSAMERALGTQFGFYKKNGTTFLAPMTVPRPSVSLHVAELSNAVQYNLRSRRLVTLRASNSFIEGYSPQQLANGFDYTGAYAAGFKGDGITIGIIGTGPIADDDPRINGGMGGDVAEYRTLFGVTGTGTVTQDIDTMNVSPGNTVGGAGDEYSQGLATPPPVTSPSAPGCADQSTTAPADYTTCNPEDTEAQLDTEQSSALAPDANVNFYIAYNPNECYTAGPCAAGQGMQELGIGLTDDEIQQAIADNLSDVISMSFGASEASSEADPGYFGPGTNNFGPTELASLVSMGTAVFVSAGDNGAEECAEDNDSSIDSPCVNYPATDPSAISVGGVNAPFDNSGRLTGPMTGWGTATQYSDENGYGASGGGCSTYFPTPTYESGVTLPCGSFRSQPDVALDADTNTGVAVVVDSAPGLGGRQIGAVGGTSVSSPEMAAMWALVLQACKQSTTCATGSGANPYRLGNPGTYLYPIYQNSAEYASTFYDVLFGNNAIPNSSNDGGNDPGFLAGTGYDQVTGIGVPFAKNLITNVLAQVQ